MINAIKEFSSRKLFPTAMSSAELAHMFKGVERKSVFSARTTLGSYVEDIQKQVGNLLKGKGNFASTAQGLQELIDGYGYTPERGFPRGRKVPTAKFGAITDLSSDARVKLVVETNYRQALNYARKIEGMTPDALYDYPAWEFTRIYDREVPRGFKLVGGELVQVPNEDWPSRWKEAGGKLYDGVMIALKDSPVWEALGDSNTFSDGLNTDYPPFAFNSGYGWIQRNRAYCLAIGLIKKKYDRPDPEMKDFAAELDKDEKTKLIAELKTARAKLVKAMEK